MPKSAKGFAPDNSTGVEWRCMAGEPKKNYLQ